MLLLYVVMGGLAIVCWLEWRTGSNCPAKLSNYDLFFIVFLTLAALALRFYRINDRLVWLDEDSQAFSSWGTPNSFLVAASKEQQPPLNYILEGLALKTFGYWPWVCRLQSLIFGTLTVPAIYLFLRNLNLSTFAVTFGAALCAFGYPFLYFSREGRPYAAAFCAAVLLLNAFIIFWKETPHWRRTLLLFGFTMNSFYIMGFQPQIFAGVLGLSLIPTLFGPDRSVKRRLFFHYWFQLVLSAVLIAPYLAKGGGYLSFKIPRRESF